MSNMNGIWNKKLLQYIAYIIIFSFAAYKIIENISNKYKVKDDYQVTIGEIVEYKVFGVGPNRYLTYEYSVNGELYRREINGPNRHFDECSDNISICSDKRFPVLYSQEDPTKSLINLTIEIQDIKEYKSSTSLRNFQ